MFDCRNVSGNNFTGGLSSAWGAPGVFPNLVAMDLSQNYALGGILLTQWGMPGSLPQLQVPPDTVCRHHDDSQQARMVALGSMRRNTVSPQRSSTSPLCAL